MAFAFQNKLLWQLVRPFRGKIALLFLMVSIGTFFSMLDAQFTRILFDTFLVQIGDPFADEAAFLSSLGLFLLLWVGSALVARTLNTLSRYYTGKYTDLMGLDIFYRGFSHLLKLPLGYHERNKSGEEVQKLSKARQDITQLFDILINTFFQNFVIFAIVFGYALYLHWALAVAIFSTLPIFAAVTWWKSRQVKSFQRDVNLKLEGISGSATESFSHIFLIKALGTERREEKFLEQNDRKRHAFNQQKIRAQSEMQFIQGTTIQFSRMLLIFVAAYLAFQGTITPGEVFAILTYTFFLYNPLYELARIYTTFQEARASVERVETLLEERVTLKPVAPVIQKPLSRPPRVRLQKVAFDYETTKGVLRGVDMDIRAGTTVAFVGPSGGGKSTLAKLLIRLEDPARGKITLDGRDLRRFDRAALSQSMGVVTQENFLFANTVRYNITYGHAGEVTDEQVWRALEEAQAADFVRALPQGLDTLIGERGVRLSGGQRQRLAIARTLLFPAPLLVFDEATSALDNKTERLIKDTLKKLHGKSTVVIIAHRLSTISDADKIFVLDKGKIVQKGKYKSLLKRKGLFAALAKKQRH